MKVFSIGDILMDFSIHIDTLSIDLPILYFKGWPIKIALKVYISVSEYCFILANRLICNINMYFFFRSMSHKYKTYASDTKIN